MDNQQTKTTPTAPNALWDSYAETIATSGYDPLTKELLNWLIETGRTEKWTLTQASEKIGYSVSTLSKLLSDKRDGTQNQVVSSIAEFRRAYNANTLVADIPFVDTSCSERIMAAISYAREYQEIVSVVGNSQIGKTTACEEFKRREDFIARQTGRESNVIFIRIPTAPSALRVTGMISNALGLGKKLRYEKMLDRIKQVITPRHVIICDEIHQVCMAAARGIKTIETLREIYDECRCGMVFVGTNVWGRTLDGKSSHGTIKWHGMPMSWEGILSQTILRGINVQLPGTLTYDDQKRVWESFGLSEPDKTALAVVQHIVANYGMGRYVKRMRAGATTAAKAGEPYTWRYFLAVHKQLETLAGK